MKLAHAKEALVSQSRRVTDTQNLEHGGTDHVSFSPLANLIVSVSPLGARKPVSSLPLLPFAVPRRLPSGIRHFPASF